MTFASDTDLLYWEPDLFRDAAFASQLLLAGAGDLDGAQFTLSAGSLNAAHVAQTGVITLAGAIAGCYPIISVDDDTHLTLSVFYDGLYPDSGPAIPSPAGAATGLTFAIRTFWPQRKVASDLILRAAGIEPADADAPAILNTQPLRRACALGTLQLIYNALAAVADEPANLRLRAEMYERLFRTALRQARIELDTNADGEPDRVVYLGMLQLQRA